MNIMLRNRGRIPLPFESVSLRNVIRETILSFDLAELKKQLEKNLPQVKQVKTIVS